MSFNESQQKIIEYVKTDNSINKDFFEAEKAISKFDNTTSQEIKDRALREIVSEYFTIAVKKNDTEALALQNIRSDITGVDLSIFTTTIESKEKINNSYTFLNIIQQNPTVYNTIKSYIKEPETIEHRSQSIENIRGEFALSAMDKRFQKKFKEQPQLRQNIQTGISLYFTDRLNNLSTHDLKQVTEIGGIGTMIGKASDLMGIFGKLSSFKNQMSSINTILEGIDIYSDTLIEDDTKKIEFQTAFQSPELFLCLLKKHTSSLTKSSTQSDFKSFEEYFLIENTSTIDVNNIVAGLGKSYTPETHGLMNKVLIMGPSILKKRNELQGTFKSVYNNLSEVMSLVSGGKTLSEALKGTWLGNVADFVGALLGLGNLKQYERKEKIKELTKKCPEQQRNGIYHAISYLKKYNNENVYTKTSNNFSKLFDTIDTKQFELQKTTKELVINTLPDEQLLKDSFQSAVENTGFFVHPKILFSAGITNINDYMDGDGDNKPYKIKENKKEEYKKLLLDNKDKICAAGRKGILQPSLIIDMVAEGKGKQEISSLLLSGLSFPDYAIDLIKNDILSSNSILAVNTLVGYGATQGKEFNIQQEEVLADKTKEENEINIQKIKDGIFALESKNEKEPYKANNPKSSAIGKYQFLRNSRKDKIKEITGLSTEEEYTNNPKQQEKFMDHIIKNYYLPKAKEYKLLYPDWKIPEIIMLTHFKGEKGALNWIKEKKDDTTKNNISIDKYITNFQKVYYV